MSHVPVESHLLGRAGDQQQHEFEEEKSLAMKPTIILHPGKLAGSLSPVDKGQGSGE